MTTTSESVRRVDSNTNDGDEKRHRRILLLLTLLSRSISASLIYLTAYLLPLFDSSPRLLQLNELALPYLRWDTFHYLSVAQHGYAYERQWAFFPGVPLVMRTIAKLAPYTAFPLTASNLLLSGAFAALACDATQTLYTLSLHELGSPNLAFIAAVLSLIPSSPATLHFTPYAEPFFTYLSYKGMLFSTRSRWLLATLCFALAGAFRSNGTMLSGFLLWGLVARPFLEHKKVSIPKLLSALGCSTMIVTPFILHNYTAYHAFCHANSTVSVPTMVTLPTPQPSWCSRTVPLIYSHVQSTYWNVGFLRYWTKEQIPNFLIAAPPLFLHFSFNVHHISRYLTPRIKAFIDSLTHSPKEHPTSKRGASAYPWRLDSSSPFLSLALTPHVVHSLCFCCTLLFASHTQIVLRLASSMPLTYWAAAWLMVEKPIWGFRWVAWSLVWSTISVVLWAAFLPPA